MTSRESSNISGILRNKCNGDDNIGIGYDDNKDYKIRVIIGNNYIQMRCSPWQQCISEAFKISNNDIGYHPCSIMYH